MKKGVDKQHLFLYYMSSSAAVHYRKQNNDAWLSLVERCVRESCRIDSWQGRWKVERLSSFFVQKKVW